MTVQSIQHLRAVAALSVVVAHVAVYLGRLGFQGYWPNSLGAGVDLFFVISGFIMWVTTANRPISPLSFMLKRIARVAPLYWLVTGFSLAVLLTNKQLMPDAALDWGHVIRSFLFIPALHPVNGEMQPLVTAGWTLNFEMFFYVLFALALFLPQAVRALAIVLLLIGFVAARGLGPSPSSILFVYSNDIILEFGMGLLIGLFATSGKRMPVSAGLALVAVGLALLVVLSDILPPLPRFLMMGVPCAMIVIGAVALEREGAWLKSRVMQFLGDASYSIYLTHGIFLSAFTRFWPKLMPGVIAQNMVLFSLAGLTAALIGGAMVYRLVEKPLYALRIKG